MTISNPPAAFKGWQIRTATGFEYSETSGTGMYSIPAFSQSGLAKHCFTTRKGGVSTGSFAELNMSWTRTDSTDNTRRNYEIAAAALAIDPANMVIVDGDHGTNIKPIDASHKGRGLYTEWHGDKFDGMSTASPGVALCTIHGDCTPIFVLDTANKAICMAHSGWRGTVNGMPGKCVTTMQERFNSRLEDLLVGVGPCIGGCCFEVDEDVAQQFAEAFPHAGCVSEGGQAGKYLVDMATATAWQLFETGLPPANATFANMCTCCDSEHFHSFRRDGRMGGSMAGILQLI